MKSFTILVALLSMLESTSAQDRHNLVPVRDLKSDWLVSGADGFEKYDGQRSRIIYFRLGAARLKGDFLSLRSREAMDVFVNGKLIYRQYEGVLNINLDSLTRLLSTELIFAVHQSRAVSRLSTTLLAPADAAAQPDEGTRPGNGFLNFTILAGLILSAYFIFLFRSNPKLTMDYLNVSKMISIQEREDNLMSMRITSSVNLLFYLFGCASCGLVLLAVFHYGPENIPAAGSFQITSTANGFYQWLRITAVVGVFFVIKLVTIYGLSRLFRLGTARLQFFNFVRMLFVIAGILTVVIIITFTYHGYPAGPHVGLLRLAILLMSISVVTIFLKLLSSAPFRFFHLFSYLCVSEIIPLVILLKVLLY